MSQQSEPTNAEVLAAYNYLLQCTIAEFVVIAQYAQLFTPAYQEAIDIINGVDTEDIPPDVSGFD